MNAVPPLCPYCGYAEGHNGVCITAENERLRGRIAELERANLEVVKQSRDDSLAEIERLRAIESAVEYESNCQHSAAVKTMLRRFLKGERWSE